MYLQRYKRREGAGKNRAKIKKLRKVKVERVRAESREEKEDQNRRRREKGREDVFVSGCASERSGGACMHFFTRQWNYTVFGFKS